MINYDAIIEFVEPHPTGGNSTVKITVSQAICYQKELRDYMSDEDALDDFLVTHWAYVK